MKKIVVLCTLAGLLYANDADEGVKALKNGDYESAMASFTNGANNGDKVSQQNLGVMYKNGLGVKKDHYKASYWFNKAQRESESIRVSTISQ